VQENRERWMMLCEQAATEQDPQKLLELVKEINKLLEIKARRLSNIPPSDQRKRISLVAELFDNWQTRTTKDRVFAGSNHAEPMPRFPLLFFVSAFRQRGWE
jgi:hypothetical protein